MKAAATTAEEKKYRTEQAAAYKAAGWIRVTFSNGSTRMMKRADYDAMKAGR